jgi:site-specific recombinase XerD
VESDRLTPSQKVAASNPISSTNLLTVFKILSRGTSIRCNLHSFRRGFAVHLVKSGLSTRVVQALGGWETTTMVERYSKSLTFDDALQLHKQVNGDEV